MRLKQKITYLSLGILALVSILITVAAVLTIDQLLRELNETNMRVEMTRIRNEFERIQLHLHSGDVDEKGIHTEYAQRIFADFFKSHPQQSEMMMICSQNGMLIYPGEFTDKLRKAPLWNLPDTKSGMERMLFDGKPYLFIYDSFSPWKWKIVLATSEAELFMRRDSFLNSVVFILLGGLVLGGFLSFVIARSIANPLVRLAEATKNFVPGSAGKLLPVPGAGASDEVVELTHAFNSMTERLKSANDAIEAQTAGLQLANDRLTREVSQRKKAQQELAALNDKLEKLVASRTWELQSKAHELEEANLQLLRQDALKSSFLSSVSHEFRTPLTSILGFVKLIKRDYHRIFRNADAMVADPSDKVVRIRDNLSIIQDESERLSRLIDDFLDFTKIESGRFQWHDQEIDVKAAILQAANAVEGVFRDKNDVFLKMILPETLPGMYMDPDRFKQLLINLFSNALKYTDSGAVTIAACSNEGTLQIGVLDSGCGVPRSELVMVFEKYHQVCAPDTLVSKPKGTGLGLSICRQIVEHYEGIIWMESDQDKGCCVFVELPLSSGS